MRGYVFLFFMLNSLLVYSQRQGIVEVIWNKKPLSNVKVNIKREGGGNIFQRPAETNTSGNAIFKELPDGVYEVEVLKDGYKKFVGDHKLIIGEKSNNELTVNVKLEPYPDNTYSVRGKILGEEGEPLEGVEIRISTKINKDTITDKWGDFNVVFQEKELTIDKSFKIDIDKENFHFVSKKYGFNENHIELDNLILIKKNVDNTKPCTFIDIIPVAGQFKGGNKTKGWVYGVLITGSLVFTIYANDRVNYYNNLGSTSVSTPIQQQNFTKAKNWRTFRNIGIFTTSGSVIASIIDNVITCKSKALKIHRNSNNDLSFVPSVRPRLIFTF